MASLIGAKTSSVPAPTARPASTTTARATTAATPLHCRRTRMRSPPQRFGPASAAGRGRPPTPLGVLMLARLVVANGNVRHQHRVLERDVLHVRVDGVAAPVDDPADAEQVE